MARPLFQISPETLSGQKPHIRLIFGQEVFGLGVFGLGVFVLGASLSLAILFTEFYYLDGATQKNNVALGGDFSNLWVGARLALCGDLTSLFDPLAFNRAMAQMLPREVLPLNNVWSYPPYFLLPVLPFSALPYQSAYVLWMGVGMALFIWTARATAGGNIWLFLLLCPAAIANIMPGQNGFFSAALMIGGFFLMKPRPLLGGVLFGLLAFKPQLGILVPLILIMDRNWVAFASASAVVIAQIALVTLLFGGDLWPLFLQYVVPMQSRLLEEGGGPLFANLTSFFMVARVAGLGLDGAYMVQGLAALGGIIGLLRVWHQSEDAGLRFAAFIIATFLVAPYAAAYDLIPLSLVVWIMLNRWAYSRSTKAPQYPDQPRATGPGWSFSGYLVTALTLFCLAFAWCVPLIMTVLVIYHVNLPTAPFAIAGLLAIVLHQARKDRPDKSSTC